VAVGIRALCFVVCKQYLNINPVGAEAPVGGESPDFVEENYHDQTEQKGGW
jgi:hypothetical protein